MMSKRALFLIGFLFLVASCGSAEWGEPVNLGPPVNTSNWQYSPSISCDGTRLYYAHGSDDIFVSTWEDTAWGVPVNVGPNVNSPQLELSPSISSDGTKLYFVSFARPGGYGSYDIWISTWEDTIWGAPVNAGPNVNSTGRELSPSVSSDATRLYFVSWGRPGGYGSYDVWVSTWEDTIWGPAVNLGPNVNSPFDEFTANISFDSKKVYFSSNRPGSFGDDDLWVSEWDSNSSQWGPAANVGPNVNTVSADYCPSISSDDSKLYFARWMGIGHPDIFVAEWQDTIWGPAVNLGPPVNTPTWDNGPSISTDGTKLYFASSRDTNNPAIQDIWVSEWIPEGIEGENRKSRIENTRLLKIEPNPLVSNTVIRLSLAVSGDVSLKIYDISGRMVRTLIQGRKDTGHYEVLWDGRNEERGQVSSGVYFARMESGNFRATEKMISLR